jgi:conjugal transfer mating pair stabilization protein TraG
MATSEGYASALEAQGAAMGTAHRRAATTSFGDFGERTSFAASRSFGEAVTIIGEGSPTTPGQSALSLGGLDAQRHLGSLSPALAKGDLTTPEAAKAVRANATTSAIHQFAEKDGAVESVRRRARLCNDAPGSVPPL